MVGRVNEREKFISFAPGRRGKRSILDCILTVLSHRRADGTWPILTFRECARLKWRTPAFDQLSIGQACSSMDRAKRCGGV